MGRGIVFAKICLDFHNAGRKNFAPFPPDQNFSQKIAADPPRIAVVEAGGKRPGEFGRIPH
jgi:hypothetical protein